jgi:hypothetical protein
MLKDAYFQIKLPRDLKDRFYEKAQENAQNPSALVRKWIVEYLEGGEGKW